MGGGTVEQIPQHPEALGAVGVTEGLEAVEGGLVNLARDGQPLALKGLRLTQVQVRHQQRPEAVNINRPLGQQEEGVTGQDQFLGHRRQGLSG